MPPTNRQAEDNRTFGPTSGLTNKLVWKFEAEPSDISASEGAGTRFTNIFEELITDHFGPNNFVGNQDFPPTPPGFHGLENPASIATELDQPWVNPVPLVNHDRIAAPAGPINNPLACSKPECRGKKPFTRKGDLVRHQKKHAPPELHCDYYGCDRKGGKGFYRKDKFDEHRRKKHGVMV